MLQLQLDDDSQVKQAKFHKAKPLDQVQGDQGTQMEIMIMETLTYNDYR